MPKRDFIKFQGIKFFWHPFHKDYLASKCGKILSLKQKEKRILRLGKNGKNNYLIFCLSEKNKKKFYLVHRFVFETFKGEIPSDKQVDHADNCKENNFISNLQLLTPKENHHKSHCKKVISLNIESGEEKIFNSFNKAAEFYQIHKSTVSMICRKINKSCKSKKDGKCYQFFYL